CRGRASGGCGWGSRGWGACHGSICSFRVVRSGPASGRWLAVQAALGFAATRPTPATGIVAGGDPRGARRAADGEIALAHQRVLQNPVRGDVVVELLVGPRGDRVDLDEAVRLVPGDKGGIRSCRSVDATDTGDPAGVVRQRVPQ